MFRVLLSFSVLALLGQSAFAQNLGLPFKPFQKKIEADPNKSYTLGQKDGPWLILVTTFAGEKAPLRAQELALELRKNFRLKTYVHKTVIDLTEKVDGLYWNEKKTGDDEAGNLERQKMKNLNGGSFEEISVLVGDFHSVEDPNAQKTLDRIKTIKPRTYSREGTRATNQFIGAMREIVNMNSSKKSSRGPFRTAFMIPNPTLPEDAPDFAMNTMSLVLNLSSRLCSLKYSLLATKSPAQSILYKAWRVLMTSSVFISSA